MTGKSLADGEGLVEPRRQALEMAAQEGAEGRGEASPGREG